MDAAQDPLLEIAQVILTHGLNIIWDCLCSPRSFLGKPCSYGVLLRFFFHSTWSAAANKYERRIYPDHALTSSRFP